MSHLCISSNIFILCCCWGSLDKVLLHATTYRSEQYKRPEQYNSYKIPLIKFLRDNFFFFIKTKASQEKEFCYCLKKKKICFQETRNTRERVGKWVPKESSRWGKVFLLQVPRAKHTQPSPHPNCVFSLVKELSSWNLNPYLNNDL